MVGIEVTHVDIRLAPTTSRTQRLRAFAEVTLNGAIRLDNFLVQRGSDGRMSICFPLRPRRIPCGHCGRKTYATLPRCGHCQRRIAPVGSKSYPSAFPAGPGVHALIESAVLRAYCQATTPTLRLANVG